MRLKVVHSREPRHKDTVSSVGWASSDAVYSCGDDHQLLRWDLVSMDAQHVGDVPSSLFPTAMHWHPRAKGQDGFALASSDGKVCLFSKSGKLEKTVDAHKGAVLALRWSPDGTGLLSGGEDGAVKMWSRNGMLRSLLAQMPSPIYSVCWDGSASRVLYSSKDTCYIKALKAQVAPVKWKAHDGIVMCADWNSTADLIVTGGEDCKFKVWDGFGRPLFSSSPHDYPVTAVAWNVDGDLFAVGSYNILRLCDRAGWSHSLEKLSAGSVYCISWSPDGTQLSAGCASGHVIHAAIIDKRVSYRNLDIVQTRRSVVEVRDVSSDVAREQLETKDRVTRFSIGHEHLVVITTKQCYIYNSSSWNTPSIFDLKESGVRMLIMAQHLFLLSDGGSLHIHNYEGRQLCEIKQPAGPCSERVTALSSDCVAVRDRIDPHTVQLLDPHTGKAQGDGKITHTCEMIELCLSQHGVLAERMIAFRDSASSVHVAMCKTFGANKKIEKIGSMCEQLCFNDDYDMLAGLQESRVIVWPVPGVVFTDRNLLERTEIQKEVTGMGRFPVLMSFSRDLAMIRRSDGSLTPVAVPAFPAALLRNTSEGHWDQAIRLARQVKDDTLWAMLAGLAAQQKNLYAAEIAYGALDEAEIVSMLTEARTHSNKDVRAAMLLILTGKIQEADALLERTGNVFRCIMLNTNAHRWSRALDVAVKNKRHIDTVIGYRQRYLNEMGLKETDAKFIKHTGDVEIDWDHIREQIAADEQKDK